MQRVTFYYSLKHVFNSSIHDENVLLNRSIALGVSKWITSVVVLPPAPRG